MENIKKQVFDWMNNKIKESGIADLRCKTRDIFQSRLDKF